MAMLMLKDGETLDCTETFVHISNYLPSFAWPLFIRTQVTGGAHFDSTLFITLKRSVYCVAYT